MANLIVAIDKKLNTISDRKILIQDILFKVENGMTD